MIDCVSVEEFDWSAESQVLIPAEHFWLGQQRLVNNLGVGDMTKILYHDMTNFISR